VSIVIRQKLSDETALQLGRYYGGKRCVVTKTTSSHYHHLDDDDSNTSFVNLIPLASNYNCPVLRDARIRRNKMQAVVLPADLHPDALNYQASLHFARWDIALGYGCARLAYFVAKNYLGMDVDSSIEYSCSAMYSARHTANYDLIHDILLRDFIPIVESRRVSARTREFLIQEVAGLSSDHGHHKRALRLYQLNPYSKKAASRHINAERHAAILRRRAIAVIAERGANATSRSLLRDAREANPNSENLTAGLINTQAWECLSHQDYPGAHELLEEFYHRYVHWIFTREDVIQPITITAWNAAEVFHNYAIAAAHLGPRYKARSDRALDCAARLYNHCGTFPFALRSGLWIPERRIYHDALGRGVEIRGAPRLPARIDRLIENVASKLAA
jgi:hypothetical protein